ncbi:DUF2783 domain-containing protein [Denitrobaculum tricleocarpae]|uniref:DUF2783 domain-containing protein n=1 Tax=Denitrobaculum tricleocarpae TaxID=2591009 RepID=A0A545T5J0_9PROT|nr:DUF2783 domain-containing protein [Denitrobaculum tricleocarpae]TQV72473.1 DUF2783 domain-containing protein [Denitrobaculum tricleocarpae]
MSTQLKSDPRLTRPDDIYQVLIDAHRDLSPEQSQAFNSRLVLLLTNHIGDEGVIAEAVEAAGKGL